MGAGTSTADRLAIPCSKFSTLFALGELRDVPLRRTK